MTTASSGSTLLAGVSAFLTGAGTDERRHYRVLYGAVMIFFALFLGVPLALIFGQSILEKGTLTATNWLSVVMRPGFWSMMANSFAVSTAAAAVATLLGFFAAPRFLDHQQCLYLRRSALRNRLARDGRRVPETLLDFGASSGRRCLRFRLHAGLLLGLHGFRHSDFHCRSI